MNEQMTQQLQLTRQASAGSGSKSRARSFMNGDQRKLVELICQAETLLRPLWEAL